MFKDTIRNFKRASYAKMYDIMCEIEKTNVKQMRDSFYKKDFNSTDKYAKKALKAVRLEIVISNEINKLDCTI